ncbi:ATP-binding cassette sub-family G member 8 [Aphelenchoides bicaudatus]|nr:ATP-binding cassette sub-family G member 8 [Aphelenchoides bicaudatus]
MEFIKIFKRQNGKDHGEALESAFSHQQKMEEQFVANQNFHFSPTSSSQHNGYIDKPTPTTNNNNLPKGLPRTLLGGNSLLDEITAAASLAAFEHSSPANSSNQHEWDLSPNGQPIQRSLLRPVSSVSEDSCETSDMHHYAESDIPLPPPPFMSSNGRMFHQQFSRLSNDDMYEEDLDNDQDTIETNLRSYDENNRRLSQRQQRHLPPPVELTNLHRHQNHYFSNVDLFQQNDASFNYLKYARASNIHTNTSSSPHIRIIDVCFDYDPRSNFDRLMLRAVDYRRLLHHITFELFAGDTLALLYTSESEMQTFIRVLSHSEIPNGKMHGVLEINGHKLKPRQFGERVAHVSSSELHSGLTLMEYLNLYSSFIQPATNAFKKQDTIEHLIQGLALVPFKNQLIENLGHNEVQRLKLANLLICENVLRDMDLYDLAFVIDFIRDWAQRLKRIAIIAINPPTLEILTMFNKTALLACGGRFVFMGESGELCNYFQAIGYSCPAFKNPCDYFVDLITHDVLTLESARESITRIRTLSEIWTHKMPALHPPRGNIVSPKIQHSGPFAKTFLVYRLFWHRILNRPLALCWEIALSILLSLLIGWIFFQLPTDRRSGINDRLGFLCTILLVCQIPLALFGTRTVINDWPILEQASSFRAFTPINYLFAKLAFDLPIATLSAISYALPAYILANQNQNADSEMSTLTAFAAVIFLNFLFNRYAAWCFAFFAQNRMTICILLIFSGFAIHSKEQILEDIQLYNPIKILGADLLRASFTGKSSSIEMANWLFDLNNVGNRTEILIDCQKKKILATKLKQIPIYTVAQCLKTTGSEAFRFSGFLTSATDSKHASLILIGLGVMIFVSLIALVHQRHVTQKPISIRTFN